LHVEVKLLVQVARQHCEDGVVREPLEQLADVGDPERPLEAGADFLEAGADFLKALGEGQSGSRVEDRMVRTLLPAAASAVRESDGCDEAFSSGSCELAQRTFPPPELLYSGCSVRTQW
jgi:hypothetical protein